MSDHLLSYGRQLIEEDDIAAVVDVLRGDWLTTGPTIEKFERALAAEVGAEHAIVCNSGTAALYLAIRAAGLGPADAVIVPSITFVATASAAILAGCEVVFADVDPHSGLMTADHADAALKRAGNSRVKAVLPVHLSGRMEDPHSLREWANRSGIVIIEDACHALGTTYDESAHGVGSCRDSLAACFSFHPVKTIAMGEGGAITTNSAALAAKARLFRNHGMSRDVGEIVNKQLALSNDGSLHAWYYEVREISHNLRASDINCALGLSQLKKLRRFVTTRRQLMARYETRLSSLAPAVRLIAEFSGIQSAWHLCSVLINFDSLGITRDEVMYRLRTKGIGTQVHYIPVHEQPFYSARYENIDLPGASAYYAHTLSLPLHAGMSEHDVDTVVEALETSLKK